MKDWSLKSVMNEQILRNLTNWIHMIKVTHFVPRFLCLQNGIKEINNLPAKQWELRSVIATQCIKDVNCYSLLWVFF